MLSGGGIAAYYTTGYAAFGLYGLVSCPAAYSFMTAVTLLGFVLSLRQGGAPLSIVATVGGLGTPFLLYTGSGGVTGLVGYTCLVLAGATAIYLYRGWRSLLWISAVGGWIVLLLGRSGLPPEAAGMPAGTGALQLGIIFACPLTCSPSRLLLSAWRCPVACRGMWPR